MTRHEIEKLLSDIANYFTTERGKQFAKSMGWLVADRSAVEARADLLEVIQHLAEIIDESRTSSKT